VAAGLRPHSVKPQMRKMKIVCLLTMRENVVGGLACFHFEDDTVRC